MGPKQCIKKEAILAKNDDVGRLSRFPESIICVESLFGKLLFLIAPGMVPWLLKKTNDQSGGPRTNLEVFGDEVSFQYFPKNMKIDFPHVLQDQTWPKFDGMSSYAPCAPPGHP